MSRQIHVCLHLYSHERSRVHYEPEHVLKLEKAQLTCVLLIKCSDNRINISRLTTTIHNIFNFIFNSELHDCIEIDESSVTRIKVLKCAHEIYFFFRRNTLEFTNSCRQLFNECHDARIHGLLLQVQSCQI